MNKRINVFLVLAVLVFLPSQHLFSQQKKRTYTLEDVLLIARQQSPMAVMAKHRFRGSYWEFRTYKAGFLPMLTMNTTIPDLNRSIDKITLNDGSDAFVERKLINSSADLELRQNIGLTGGSIYMRSDLQRIDNMGENGQTSYLSYPINIGIQQPVNGYNEYHWERQIAPLKYEESQRNYIQSLEQVSLRAVNYFFDLALAQKNLEIARVNYSNADTLYRIAKGRYQLGTIAENELLQMELSFLNTGTDLNSAQIDLAIKKFQLNSFLGLNQNENIELVIPFEIPDLEIKLQEAIEQAQENNPDVLDRQQQLLQADQEVDRTRAEKGLNATISASFGLSQRANELKNLYANPQDQERVRVGLSIPLMDWGLGKGHYRMAQSAQEVAKTNVQQAEMDFQQEVLLEVMQFNLQDDQLKIAAKADTVGTSRYHVSKQRFLIGKISVLDLNVAQTEKDEATRRFISALRNYWTYFYTIRSLTLYDWLNNSPLEQDFDSLLR
ncbi:MAG TPA: TolC family protein [Bacteroidales bacterium]|nr:TolC family protein [Bacteroidales bacterium]